MYKPNTRTLQITPDITAPFNPAMISFVSMSIVVSDSVHMVRPPSPPTVSYVTCMPYNNNNNNENNNNRGLDTAHELILLDASTRALLWFLRSCPNTLCMVRPSVLVSLIVTFNVLPLGHTLLT